jgi:hypothetical protein
MKPRLALLLLAAWVGANPDGAQSQSVQPLSPAELARVIDQHLEARLAAEGTPTSPLADDVELARRLHLDLHGVVPSIEQTVAFLQQSDSRKGIELINGLLASPSYGLHQADLWDNLLLPLNTENRRVPLNPLRRWMAAAFNENRPWSETVHTMLTSVGPQDHNAAITLFLANSRSLAPHEATDLVSRLFLGVRLECAQCHDHPFDRWTQDDYWGLAAFFGKMHFTSKFDGLSLPPREGPRNKEQNGTNYGIIEVLAPRKQRLPEQAKSLPPRFLDGTRPAIDPEVPPLRPALADWMTSADNPWFAKAMVNRTWGQLFGRGLVNPVDDLRPENPATHPELLEVLTQQFVAHGFDLKYLIRGICQSRAYQRTSRPADGNESDTQGYSRMTPKVLSPEQLFDSLAAILGEEALCEGRPVDDTRSRFVEFFETDDEPDPTAYRRGIPQVLKLMNHGGYERAVAQRAAEITADRSASEAVEQLYLLALARRPDAQELRQMVSFLEQPDDRSQASASLLWVLLISSEFALNH